MSFVGKIVFVTGAAREQGQSHAVAFAEAGADVAICDLGGARASVNYPLGSSEALDETDQRTSNAS